MPRLEPPGELSPKIHPSIGPLFFISSRSRSLARRKVARTVFYSVGQNYDFVEAWWIYWSRLRKFACQHSLYRPPGNFNLLNVPCNMAFHHQNLWHMILPFCPICTLYSGSHPAETKIGLVWTSEQEGGFFHCQIRRKKFHHVAVWKEKYSFVTEWEMISGNSWIFWILHGKTLVSVEPVIRLCFPRQES